MHTRDTCEAIEPLLAPYTEPDSAALMDAADQARVAAHLEACEPCRRTAGCCRAAQAALRSNAGALSAEAPGLLAARCRAVAARASAPRRATRWVGWSAVGATAAVILFIFMAPTQAVATQLAMDHMKCAKFSGSAYRGAPEYLEYIWRDRRQQDIVIPDGDAAQGLRLVGLRRCVSTEGNMAHVMYERGGTPLSLFVLGDGDDAGAAGHDAEVATIGHKALLWTSGAATYVLVGRAADVAGAGAWMRQQTAGRRIIN